MKSRQAILLVLDSVGIGAAPDAAAYGDLGANTLANLADAVGGLSVPHLERLGLGRCAGVVPGGPAIGGVKPVENPAADFGVMQEVSRGKDTTVGHWEMAGIEVKKGFRVFPAGPPSFPAELISEFEARTGRAVIANRAASGTAIIQELGAQQMAQGCWSVYTSADSVMQIAVHEDVIPLDELYAGCAIARELCDPLMVGRVIARPFVGEPGLFRRTDNRRDFSLFPPEPTVMDRLVENRIPVVYVGKVDDIFAHKGMTRTLHSESNRRAEQDLLHLVGDGREGLIFANLIDFDMLYGHRRDPEGYARALEETDCFIGELIALLEEGALLIITADHGNDPTFRGTDHTRELVPLLVYQQGRTGGRDLGIRMGFFDVAQSLASFFGILPIPRGVSFIP